MTDAEPFGWFAEAASPMKKSSRKSRSTPVLLRRVMKKPGSLSHPRKPGYQP
ncbi:hypothetical protein ACVLD2_003844 [Paenibacillus sp. PvR052]